MVYNASPVTALRDFGDPFYLARLQLIWTLVAVVAGIVAYKINYKIFEQFAPIFMIGAILLLLAVFIPGFGVKIYGAQRWISVGGIFSIQPAEIAKLAYVAYLAALFSKKLKLTPFLVVTALVAAIVLLQRDLGTTVVISTVGLIMYFLAEAPLAHFFTIIPVGILAAAVFVLGSDYRRSRLLSFLDPTQDPQGTSYHINQILIALGSGGIFGVGLGQSRQKYGFIPEVTTDSIFAIVGNEFGFIGSLILIILFAIIIIRGFQIAKGTNDRFGKLLALGITSWIGVQTFINLAGMVALLPLTGIPLPFISYGGSSLVSVIMSVGILLNISKYTSKNTR